MLPIVFINTKLEIM